MEVKYEGSCSVQFRPVSKFRPPHPPVGSRPEGFVARVTVRLYARARPADRQTDRQTHRRRTMKTSAGCDENMNDDEEERRENEGVHGRVVDDERVERGEGTRGGLEEDDTHGEEDETACKTPTAVRGGAGGFPFGAGGWTPPTRSDYSTPGSPGCKALHAFADELFRAWLELNQDSELRVASFCKFGELIDKLVQSDDRAQHNLTFNQIFGKIP